jgi:hypothetical protein
MAEEPTLGLPNIRHGWDDDAVAFDACLTDRAVSPPMSGTPSKSVIDAVIDAVIIHVDEGVRPDAHPVWCVGGDTDG